MTKNVSRLLSLSRTDRVDYVKRILLEAFRTWKYAYAAEGPMTAKGFRSAEDSFSQLPSVADWRSLVSTNLEGVIPEWLVKEKWLQLLPGFMLCRESAEEIGFPPTVLGLPPNDGCSREVISTEELLQNLTPLQAMAIRDYTELYHWLRHTPQEYSHYDAFWHQVPDVSSCSHS